MRDSSMKEYSIWEMAKEYGIGNILKSRMLWLAIGLSLIVSYLVFHYVSDVSLSTFHTVSSTIIAVNAALLGLVLAAFAIVVSFTDKELTLWLRQENFLGGLNFVFIEVAYVLAIGILTNLLTIVLVSLTNATADIRWPLSVLYFFNTGSIVYGLMGSVGLVKTTAYYWVFRAHFETKRLRRGK
jgi:hypothetical protein